MCILINPPSKKIRGIHTQIGRYRFYTTRNFSRNVYATFYVVREFCESPKTPRVKCRPLQTKRSIVTILLKVPRNSAVLIQQHNANREDIVHKKLSIYSVIPYITLARQKNIFHYKKVLDYLPAYANRTSKPIFVSVNC